MTVLWGARRGDIQYGGLAWQNRNPAYIKTWTNGTITIKNCTAVNTSPTGFRVH